MVYTRSIGFFAAVWLLVSVSGAFGQDGLFADFVTSKGSFTCKLEFEKVPLTVGNFVGLATGDKTWLDFKTGEASNKPFYEGITFHRVVNTPNPFVIQGGSPAGDGRDGPGYLFRDEFNPTLRHSKAGILSMANSGANSNGSQFFVTLAATPHLDDIHSVFGEVTTGMDVINAIAAVPVDVNSKPVTPVVIQSVTIRRVGAAANAFNAAAQPLAIVGGAGPKMIKEAAGYSLNVPWASRSDYFLFRSTNLTTWTSVRLGFSGSGIPAGNIQVGDSGVKEFFRVPQVEYPAPQFEPLTFAGKRLEMNWVESSVTHKLIVDFDQAGTGTVLYDSATANGSLLSYTWDRQIEYFRGELILNFNSVRPKLQVRPTFTSASGGPFVALSFSTVTGVLISGTFTVTDTPVTPSPSLALLSAPVKTKAVAKAKRTTRTARSRR